MTPEELGRHVVVDMAGCWRWTASIDAYGYGRITNRPAHRVSYEVHVGPIPDGLQLDHLCRVRSCVNPNHLEPVTLYENLMRSEGPSAINSRKTHCKRGHPLTRDNLVEISPRRICKTCKVEREIERRRRWNAIARRERAAIACRGMPSERAI